MTGAAKPVVKLDEQLEEGMMMRLGTRSEFDTVPLSEIVDPARGISYGIVQPGQHVPNGVPIVRVTDIRNGRIDPGDPLRVAPGIAAKYKRTHLRGGELLLTAAPTVGRHCPSTRGRNCLPRKSPGKSPDKSPGKSPRKSQQATLPPHRR